MTKVLIIAALVLIGLALVSAWAGRKAMERTRRRVDELVSGQRVELRERANLYGLKSKGARQNRGLGVLVLTTTELLFVPVVGRAEIRVPRSSITGVRSAKGYLGKTQGRALVIVTWDRDEAAWDVRKTRDWQTALQVER